MASSIRKNLAALVISLAFPVISLPAPALAVVAAPVVDSKKIQVVTEGVRTPAGVTVDAEGNVYVADSVRRGVTKYNKYGKQIMFFKTVGIPQRVAVSSHGNGSVYVSQGEFVAEYNNNGVETFRFTQSGGQQFTFRCATGIAVHPVSGNVYVADSGDKNVRVFTAAGVYTGTNFGASFQDGAVTTSLGLPVDLVITDEWPGGVRTNNVIIVDAAPIGRPPIATFSDAGSYLNSMCTGGVSGYESAQCKFALPLGIAVEYTSGSNPLVNRIYTTDTYQGWVVAYDQQVISGQSVRGNFSGIIGSYGTGVGELITPSGLAFDGVNKRLIVANGFGNITFYPVDNGSNPTSSDKILPIFTINPLSANNVTDPNLSLAGTREGSDVKIHVKVTSAGVQVGATTYPVNTSWACNITGLAEGRNDIVVEASDAAGNIQSQTITVYYIRSATAGFTINAWPQLTASTSYTFTGTKAAGAALSTTPSVVCTYSPDNTSWSCPIPLSEGLNSVVFTVNGQNTTANITRDTVLPVLDIYTLSHGDSTSTTVQNIVGTVQDENLDKVTVSVNGAPAQTLAVNTGISGKQTFNFPVVLNQAGSNTISIVATDKVNNTTTDNRTISLNMNAPQVVVSTPSDGKVIRNSNADVSISGTVDKAGSTCTVGGAAATMSGLTWSSNVTLSPGYNNIVISCVNNLQTSKMKRTIYYDVNSLEVAVNTPGQDKSTNASSLTVQGTVDPGADMVLKNVNGVSSAVPYSNGSYSFTIDLNAEGVVPYTVTVLDATGTLTSSLSRSIIADKTPPSLGITYVSNNASSIAGSVEPGATVAVFDLLGAPVGSVTYGAGTFTASLGQNYDLFSLVVKATDPAGNITTKSAGKPDGDCNANGIVDLSDASFCLDIVAGIRIPSALQVAHCDVGPLKNGQISPNGQVEITDCINTLRKANSLPPVWW